MPVDFETDDLADALAQAGYVADRPTLFVWEGVSQYLSAAGVDSVLAVIRKVARAGGRFVLTYVDRSVIDGHSPEFPEAAKWLRGVNKRSEPWIFGISPAKRSRTSSPPGGFASSRMSPLPRQVPGTSRRSAGVSVAPGCTGSPLR